MEISGVRSRLIDNILTDARADPKHFLMMFVSPHPLLMHLPLSVSFRSVGGFWNSRKVRRPRALPV
jgi:hypothetical protein